MSKAATHRSTEANGEVSKAAPTNGQSLIAREARADDLLLHMEGGDVVVREHVVGMIAALAIKEVEGVAQLEPFGTSQALEALAKRVGGGTKRDLGVRVEMGKLECAVDCRIVANYGVSIPDVAGRIRESVRARVAEMTGLVVKEVNIEVTDLFFDDGQAIEPAADGRQLR